MDSSLVPIVSRRRRAPCVTAVNRSILPRQIAELISVAVRIGCRRPDNEFGSVRQALPIGVDRLRALEDDRRRRDGAAACTGAELDLSLLQCEQLQNGQTIVRVGCEHDSAIEQLIPDPRGPANHEPVVQILDGPEMRAGLRDKLVCPLPPE